jgi:hypothetical protein
MFNGLVRDARRDEVLEALSAAGPTAVYAGLLAYALGRNYKLGWAAYAFKEIFGVWPRPQDRRVGPQALPNNILIDEWAAGRKRKARPRQLDLVAGQDSAT